MRIIFHRRICTCVPNITDAEKGMAHFMTGDISGKRVLFITTKNLDYIRNVQELALVRQLASSCQVIGSCNRHYFFRVLGIFLQLSLKSVRSFDTVLIGFAPQLVLPLFCRKFRKQTVVIDFFISLYDTFCLDRKRFAPESLPGHFLHYLDRVTLSLADWVICDTLAHGRFFVEEFQMDSSRLYPLYLEADRSVYHPVRVEKPEHLKDRHIVLYFGSILPLQGADVVLKAMSLVLDPPSVRDGDDRKGLSDRFFFYFIGPLKGKTLQALRPQSPNIQYIPWLPQKELAALIASSDLCLAGHFSGTIAKARRTIPGKAYIYQAMKKPMILGDNPANHELFVPDTNTVFVKMGDPLALADGILTFFGYG